jgi:hypothetical protein
VSVELAGDELGFEHVGTMACGDRLLICDVEYLPPRFAGMQRGKVSLGPEIEIVPGVWQVLVAREGDDDAIRFVLLTHERELELDDPLEQAEAVALLRVDSGRITALDPELRDDESMQTAVIEAPREQVPCMLRPLDARAGEDPRGVLLDIDLAGVLELHAPPGRPRSALFLVLDPAR